MLMGRLIWLPPRMLLLPLVVPARAMPEPDAAPASEQLLRMTAAQDMLAGMTERRALLDETFKLVPGHRLDQTLRCIDGAYSIERALLQLTEGMPFRANVDAFNAYLVTRLDGTRTLREAIADAVQAAPMRGMETDEVEAATLRSVRRMLELGFIEIRGVK